MNSQRRFSPFLLTAVLTLTAFQAAAQWPASYADTKGMNERFRLDLGGFFQDFTTVARYDDSLGQAGTPIDLEKDLGIPDRRTTFRLDGYWRFGPHGRLDFGYKGWKRQNTRTLDREIEFGDTVFHVGANVDSLLRVNVAELYYSYSFLNTGVVELGAGLGISSYWNRVALDASASAGGTSGSASYESRDLIAPIPAIQGYVNLTLLPRLFLDARARWVSATISDYSGSMVDLRGGLDYFFTQSFGIGAAYNYVKIEYERTGGATRSGTGTLRLEYEYSGPLAYVSIAF